MNIVKERAVGEQFELCCCIYEAIEGETCRDCVCYIMEENECTDIGRAFGPCSSKERKDKKDVIFIKVGEKIEI